MKKLLVLFLMFFIAIGSVSAALDNAEVYYSLDDSDNTGSNPDDLSTNGRDGTNNGATTGVTGKLNEAFSFDGSNDDITSSSTFSGSTSYSVGAWVKIDNNAVVGGYTMFEKPGTGGDLNWRVRVVDSGGNTIQAGHLDGSWERINTAWSYTTGQWYHIVLTYNATTNTQTFYVDGASHSSRTAGADPSANAIASGTNYIGSATGSQYFPGDIDEYFYYDRELQLSEIGELYNSGTGFNPYAGGSSGSNFTVTVTDGWDASAINNVTVTLANGSSWTNSTGNIVELDVLINESVLSNFTVLANDGTYFNRSYNNYNLSSNLAATLNQSIITFNASEILTGNPVTGVTFTISANTDNPKGLSTGNYTVTASKSGYFDTDKNFEVLPLDNKTVTVTGMSSTAINITAKHALDNNSINTFDGWLYHAPTSTNITFSTTSGFAEVSSAENETFTLYINTTDYATFTTTITPNATVFNYTAYLYTFNSILFYFRDYLTQDLVTENITLELISDAMSKNYTTTNGTVYATLLDPETYVARYSSANYTERFYRFTLLNDSNQSVILYMINNSDATNITIKVYDQQPALLPGAIIKALRYDLDSNSYLLQEIRETDTSGQSIMSLTFNDEFYKFIVEYNDRTLLTTDPQYITSTEVILNVDTGSTAFGSFFDYLDFEGNLTYNNVTNNFNYQYNDVNNIGSNYCLRVYRLIGSDGRSLVGSSCSTSTSGSILVGITPINESIYVGEGYYDGLLVDAEEVSFTSKPDWGDLGLFLSILIIIVFVFIIASTDPRLTPLGVGVGLLISKSLGMINFGWGAVSTIVVVAVVIAIMFRGSR